MNKGRKISGGKYHKIRKTRKHERIRQKRTVKLSATKNKKLRARGGKKRTILLTTNIVNITNQTTKKTTKTKIKNVLETPQNRFLARQNILQKGAIIETEAGKAKITNRPSQEGSINAILVIEKEIKQ
ncbi:MAG: 30S ribosomal protein S8e [Nanoarchaeota archaeon]|nr:30S ribosomal protein S8e [Nanoarchaeota archaeon]